MCAQDYHGRSRIPLYTALDFYSMRTTLMQLYNIHISIIQHPKTSVSTFAWNGYARWVKEDEDIFMRVDEPNQTFPHIRSTPGASPQHTTPPSTSPVRLHPRSWKRPSISQQPTRRWRASSPRPPRPTATTRSSWSARRRSGRFRPRPSTLDPEL